MKMEAMWKDKKQLIQAEKEQEELQEQLKLKEKAQEIMLLRVAEEYITSSKISDVEKDAFTAMFDPYDGCFREYIAGDKVRYNGEVYKVIQPHTSEPHYKPSELPALYTLFYQTSTSDGKEVIPEWVQPQGSHDVYNTGDLVTHNNKVWESEVEVNVWEPGEYGWIESVY